MIVNATPTGYQLIYQRAHALLAAQIVSDWRIDQRPARWTETLAAIIQHDDGGLEWEGSELLTPAGAPKDFKLGTISLRQPTESIMHASYQGRYIALLQSMHVERLYQDFTDEPGFADFLAEQTRLRAQWRRALKITKAEADACYALLYWGDAFSLILCQRQLPTDGRSIEIGAGPEGTRYFAALLPGEGGSDPRAGSGEQALTVDPWPFENDSFSVSIEATTIEGLVFESDGALIDAMQGGTLEPLTWHFKRSAAQQSKK